jgi:hypothetical protein
MSGRYPRENDWANEHGEGSAILAISCCPRLEWDVGG